VLVINHLKSVEAAVKQMAPQAAVAFALSCIERQWPLLARALDENPSLKVDQNVFRRAIDAAWEFCLDGTPIPKNYSEACLHEVADEGGTSPLAAIHTILNSIADALCLIEESDWANLYQLSSRNLELIELLLDDRGFLLDDLEVEGRPCTEDVKPIFALVTAEIQHQNEDLERLKDPSRGMILAVKA
jgi:hypothetical protein